MITVSVGARAVLCGMFAGVRRCPCLRQHSPRMCLCSKSCLHSQKQRLCCHCCYIHRHAQLSLGHSVRPVPAWPQCVASLISSGAQHNATWRLVLLTPTYQNHLLRHNSHHVYQTRFCGWPYLAVTRVSSEYSLNDAAPAFSCHGKPLCLPITCETCCRRH